MKRRWIAVMLAVNLVLSGSTLAFAAETDGSLPEALTVISEAETKDELIANGNRQRECGNKNGWR